MVDGKPGGLGICVGKSVRGRCGGTTSGIRYMKPKLETIGLGWANFQVMRRTHASLGHEAGIDPKVAADQRGHGIGVAIDVYTKAALSKRAEAAEQLEKAVFTA